MESPTGYKRAYQLEVWWNDTNLPSAKQFYDTKEQATAAMNQYWEKAYEITVRRMFWANNSWHVAFLSPEDFDDQTARLNG
jgi:hypothetical protein